MDTSESASADVSIGSMAWQAAAAGEQVEPLGGYLDRVAALPLLQRVADTALTLLRLAPGQEVLEVGCGTGVFLPRLARQVGPAGRVIGIDRAPEFVLAARDRVVDLELDAVVVVEEADAYRLPLPDNSVDRAHCERVLMHLDHPLAALAELSRVVKPGGWIVAAEPDWGGLTIDHPDREAMDTLLGVFVGTSFRNPRMGLELNRRFAELGLVDRSVVPVFDFVATFDGLARYGLQLEQSAETAIARGDLTRSRVEAALRYLDTADRDQRLCGYIGCYVAAGRVPG